MPPTSLLRRLMWAQAALLAVGALVAWLVLAPPEPPREQLELEQAARLLEPLAVDLVAGRGSAEPLASAAAGGAIEGLELAVLDTSGMPLWQSQALAQSGTGLLWLPEFQRAALKGEASVRVSDSAGAGRREVHVRALREEQTLLGFLRLEAPAPFTGRSGGAFLGRLLGGLAVSGLVLWLISRWLARSVERSLAEMTRFVDQLREGRVREGGFAGGEGELGRLGTSLDHLGQELSRRIAEETGDEAQLRAMLAGMVEGVIGVDDEDRVVFSNRAAVELLGLGREARTGARLWELIRQPELDALVQEARKSDAAARRVVTLSQEGRERVLGVQAHSFRTPRSGGVVIVLDDITELRRLERIRRDFVANVSHELKTPLTSIRGYVETLLEGALHDSENNERFLRKVQDNVMRLNHLVTDLLSLARIESQEGALAMVVVEWRSLLTQAARRHEGAARLKGIDLRLQVPAEELRVLGDAESLTQVVDNLVDNAIKYTGEGGSVTLALGRDGEQAVLEVRDTGLGIPPEDLERIFERFYRVDKARSRAVGGTGLGLSIVKHLVQAMSGTVSVESEHGRGSTFRVHLPLALDDV